MRQNLHLFTPTHIQKWTDKVQTADNVCKQSAETAQ